MKITYALRIKSQICTDYKVKKFNYEKIVLEPEQFLKCQEMFIKKIDDCKNFPGHELFLNKSKNFEVNSHEIANPEDYLLECTLFNELKTTRAKLWWVAIPKVVYGLKGCYCTCLRFLKKKQCAHLYEVAMKKNLHRFFEVPLTCKKRGRPKKTTNQADASHFNSRNKK